MTFLHPQKKHLLHVDTKAPKPWVWEYKKGFYSEKCRTYCKLFSPSFLMQNITACSICWRFRQVVFYHCNLVIYVKEFLACSSWGSILLSRLIRWIIYILWGDKYCLQPANFQSSMYVSVLCFGCIHLMSCLHQSTRCVLWDLVCSLKAAQHWACISVPLTFLLFLFWMDGTISGRESIEPVLKVLTVLCVLSLISSGAGLKHLFYYRWE